MLKNKNVFLIAPIFLALAVSGCAKKDPVLPGDRISIFSEDKINVIGKDIPDSALSKMNVSENITQVSTRKFEQTDDNLIWEIKSDGTKRKIFSGFPTTAHVTGVRNPIYSDGFIYAGLSTGEVVKVNASSRNVAWTADVFRPSNMTGGASMLDIISPMILEKSALFVGGLGGQFCKLKISNGDKIWCSNIATGVPFVISGGFAFVVGTDDYLYAVSTDNGDIYWRSAVENQAAPEILKSDDKVIVSVKGQDFNAKNGMGPDKN